jgi:hypothetical protein
MLPAEKVFEFADELQGACRHCATISYIAVERLLGNPLPEPADLTATVTFISFEGATYAVTAWHVVGDFRGSAPDQQPHTFFLPKAPGHALSDRFVRPPAGLIGKQPDVAIRKIRPELPGHIGKESFVLTDAEQPAVLPYALAVGYPTTRKTKQMEDSETAMECSWAAAEGVSTGYGDQVQFYSEIARCPEIVSLSGMSGGPVFWSDGTKYGLTGIVKQAMSNEESEGTISGPAPKVHFICQRFTAHEFACWTKELQPA